MTEITEINEVLFEIKMEEGEKLPVALEGKTFGEAMTIIASANNSIVKRIRAKFSQTTFTEEVEKFLSAEELMYLRLAQMMKNLGKIWRE